MEIEIDKLKELMNKFFNHLEHEGIRKVELEDDYYWHLFPKPMEIKYDPYYDKSKLINHLGLGQLYEDLEFLTSLLELKDDEDDAICTTLFLHLTPIIDYILWKIEI